LIDTAEGGHKEIEAILQRMREVSVQAANDTNNAQDRGNLQAEMDALTTEIDRISGVTTWAGNSVMDGGGGASTTASPASKTFSLQVGAATGAKNQIAVAIKAMDASTLSVGVAATTLAGDTATNATFAAATTSAKAQFTITAGAAVVATGSAADITAAVTTSVAAAAADIVTQINDSDAYQALGISAAVKSGTTDVVQLTQNTTKSHVMSADAAKQSITNIDAAIKTVNTQRSELGAISNRLTHTFPI